MNAYDKDMTFMTRLSEADKNELDKRSWDRCLCPTCPTYADCAKKKTERVFCFKGKSSCIKVSKGCHCSGCPVKVDFGLINLYFCLNGTEQESVD